MQSASVTYKRRKYIPEEEAKKKSFQMRYQTYMEVLEDPLDNIKGGGQIIEDSPRVKEVTKISLDELARRGKQLELEKDIQR